MSRFAIRLAFFAALSTLVFGRAYGTVITQWTFSAAVAAPDNNPAPTTGTGTATSLGMTNGHTYTMGYPGGAVLGTGAVTSDDVTSSPSVANPAITSEFTWRVRGQKGAGDTGSANNGWNQSAPQYSQGAEFDASTAGYKNITFSFDWYSTTQGVLDMQPQYTLNGTTWNNFGPLLLAVSNDFYGTTQPTNTLDFSGIAGADMNPSFGVRLVSAYDPTYNGPGAPAYSSAAGGTYNNNSGNWRFDNMTFSGIAVPEPSTFVLAGMALVGLSVSCLKRDRDPCGDLITS
jgi:PEP-CTERM motif